ncbi:hypothetical protein CLOSTASPAR_00566 [[Clostridium] asparagiforme DSM 15981]|uniref:Uncharacterized protein n=1 Tax=[Clostridium] asparagiforme DSM 15981 TaxID=518636 RepID=C0CUB8_9FIRM|nr:hypothetical protein CLOSTASPAR_00566 [[Clostridium] asparagiforme DSM 15981]
MFITGNQIQNCTHSFSKTEVMVKERKRIYNMTRKYYKDEI